MNQVRRNPIRKKVNMAQVYFARFVMFLIMTAILLSISFAVFFISLNSGIRFSSKEMYTPSTLSQLNFVPVSKALDDSAYTMASSPYEYKTDISAYEKYIEPEDRDEYLILINTDNLLDKSYIPADLTDVVDTRKDGRATQKLRESAQKALEAMLIEARACGVNDVTITSAYRSYAYQTELFEQRVSQYSYLGADEAYAKAATIVAIPGSSEHQSGLCADMHNLSGADVSFAKSSSAQWLKENSYKFGYILRYPEDKTEITGISFEPWHFRFVGRYHAARMYELGLCFEEYMKLSY